MTRVLDTHALMVFLEKEPGYEKVKGYFIEALHADNHLLMTSVNFAEIYYLVLREYGEKKLAEVENIIRALPLDLIDVDVPLAKEAGRIKAVKRMSYADCFAAALARNRGGELITGDREFKNMENEISILWV
ncbi:MAG: type II toxin-antitoxin system VapC family toxin [Chloroflexi bacterium]|nr:type II toxin-antitoxin system VapC family toxin [Chloroflexota bacterium]